VVIGSSPDITNVNRGSLAISKDMRGNSDICHKSNITTVGG